MIKMMILRHNQKKTGFTLIEIVISILIVSIVALAILTTFTSSYNTIFVMGKKTYAVHEAQSFLESYYSNPASIDVTVWKEVTGSLDSSLLTTYSGFNKFYKIENVTNNGENVKRVSVIVFYRNNSRQVTLSALAP